MLRCNPSLFASSLTLVMAGAALHACGSDSTTSSGSGGNTSGGSGGADASVDSADGAAGAPADAKPDLPPSPCGACGTGRAAGACAPLLAACQKNSECADILSCVYDQQPGCPLGETGAACVSECARAHCFSSVSAKLFYAAELCTYCEGTCANECGNYCAPFGVDAASADCVSLDGGLEEDGSGVDAAQSRDPQSGAW